MTIGTAGTVKIYKEQIFLLGVSYGFLTHVLLALVTMHDRYLSNEPFAAPSTKESFHTYHATALFSNKLSQPIKHCEKDALWAASALLGCIAIASIDAKCAEESWPYRAADPSDLNWLRISEGKKEIWRLANPLREDSVWSAALNFEINRQDDVPEVPQRPELDSLHPYLINLYDFDESGAVQWGPVSHRHVDPRALAGHSVQLFDDYVLLVVYRTHGPGLRAIAASEGSASAAVTVMVVGQVLRIPCLVVPPPG